MHRAEPVQETAVNHPEESTVFDPDQVPLERLSAVPLEVTPMQNVAVAHDIESKSADVDAESDDQPLPPHESALPSDPAATQYDGPKQETEVNGSEAEVLPTVHPEPFHM